MQPSYKASAGSFRAYICLVVVGSILGSLVTSVLLLARKEDEWLFIIGFAGVLSAFSTGAILGLHALTTPRRYEIHTDRLRLVARIHAWDYRFAWILSIDRLRGWRRVFFFGVNLSLGSAPAALIRMKGLPLFSDLVIAPQGRDEFLAHLQRALSDFRAALKHSSEAGSDRSESS